MTSLASDCLAEATGSLTVLLRDLAPGDAQLAEIGALWRGLESRAEPSFFRSWGWIGSWLGTLPPQRRRLLLEIRDGGRLVALGIVVPGRRRLFRLLPLSIVRLNDSAAIEERGPTIEQNGLLTLPGREGDPTLWSAAWQALQRHGFAELHIPFIAPGSFAAPAGTALRHYASDPAPFIDFSGIPRNGRVAETLLGRNGKEQLRRARKAYQGRGPLQLRAAESVAECFALLGRLEALHQATWRERGRPGSFADPFFVAFHRRLIETRFSAGEIELLALSAGEDEVGYLYNFRYRDRIYAYQSGFRYEEDKRMKPGLVCHAAAIERAAAEPNLRYYDFLGGDSRFKRGFANAVETLDSIVVARKHPLITLETMVKNVLRNRLDAGREQAAESSD